MLFLAGAALLLQIDTNTTAHGLGPRDSARDTTSARHAPHRLPVTAQLLATAFDATSTRDLYTRARHARMADDSSLQNYDAKAIERFSIGMGLGTFGRDHLLYRQESAARVQWQRGIGAWIDLTGARMAATLVKPDPFEDEGDAIEDSPIPYYVGMDPFGLGSSGDIVLPLIDDRDRDFVNPLSEDAEAYYRFESGDSLAMTLDGGTRVTVREIQFRPRVPKSNLAVGSLYFDTGSAQLVEAVYRLAVPMDIRTSIGALNDHPLSDDNPSPGFVAKALVSPLNYQIISVYIEYGLFEGAHWLPRVRTYEGIGSAVLLRIPVTMEQRFTFARVNGPNTLPPIDGARTADSGVAQEEGPVRLLEACDSSQTLVVATHRYAAQLPVAIRLPCDRSTLVNSPDLPASIFDAGEDFFGSTQRDRLVARSLSMSAQAGMSLMNMPMSELTYGVPMTRYNRIEGFSTGLGIEQQLGGGYTVGALGRFGFADRDANEEVSLARTNLATTRQVTGYNHLVSAGDWGNPLSFGGSVRALLFGRDEGFYYRATGAELTSITDVGAPFEWRLFAEEERTATQATDFSFGAPFPANLTATRGDFAGGSLRWNETLGLDPNGFQLGTDFRLEAAAERPTPSDGAPAGGDSAYGRAALDLRLSHNLGAWISTSVAVSGGSSIGGLPVQRRWYLGGLESVRGESPDTAQSGNAFWLARPQLAFGPPILRATVFGDLGWTGDRTKLANIGRPLSGVGAGLSLFDGLLRFDVARGLYPRQQWRVDLYLEGRY